LSANGEADGIKLLDNTHDGIFKNVFVSNISAGTTGTTYTGTLPNFLPMAVGIKIEDFSPNLIFCEEEVTALFSVGFKISLWER
jgi:hypothetical protein